MCWLFGVSPKDDAIFVWAQCFIRRIRRTHIDADLEDYTVALPGQLFYSTQIPVCLWFSGKKEPAVKCRAVSEFELALAA